MQINVAQLLKEPIGSRHSYHIDKNIGANDIKSVKGDVILTRTKSGIMVKCEMTALVTGICSRCLKLIDHEASYSFEEESLPSVAISEGLSSPGQFDNLIIDESQMLDMSEAIQQYALLTMPAKPLCHPDCAGICPACGQDLNKYPCQCPSRTHDQRWSKLISLGKESKT
ncbi:MAG: hypothetical protein A2Z36_03000 [Chloroflexi bacterium RBG_19FT_COMBO_48_23]|nr:MAG: hypothetical protein A2Z36_03000 [Chloroflexi bacterium RBG_19FT_COMBO_48_23]